MKLYLNGRLAGGQEQKGRIIYTAAKKAQAFCVGGDIQWNGTVRSCCPGLISWAKIYSWALTEEQIVNLSSPSP